ncbi:hypothetical protein BWO91_13220 [Plantibacter flavus]|uniref:lysylphosphatidylglycerol synthase domain-containing protein n=1 Tax=Plantibacter flavus TaxID=150123 RepID=UPI00099B592C|nr:lysylphosphatidylglycerol synthase domain-containing protein [Plantibacter flavus]AQX80794.1 hypothetical protein BWO91_13220 [Plantibacter flavus]
MATDPLGAGRRAWASFTGSAFVGWVKAHRRGIGVAVLIAFAVFLIVYVWLNPDVLADALSIGWGNLAVLFGLYVVVLLTHFLILITTVRLCGKRIAVGPGASLTVYSTVANFFGPLQTGPGVRAVYLKTTVGVRLRDYTSATLFYLFVFGAVNASLLFLTTFPWLSALGIAIGAAIVVLATWKLGLADQAGTVAAIAGITVVQALVMSVIYFVEVNAVAGPYDFMHSLVYAASANLSLFVSLTPGAIGIREGFLYFAQHLHGIPSDTIVAAGIADRAIYAVFLGVLFLISGALHLRSAVQQQTTDRLGDAG